MKKRMNRTFQLMATTSLMFAASFSFSPSASASTPKDTTDQVYRFKFRLKGETYEYTQKSSSYEVAFESAAKACYKHFKGGRRISEDQGLDIIDVCANPRST